MTRFEFTRPRPVSRTITFSEVARISDSLRGGSLAVLPTETGYMLAAAALNPDAVYARGVALVEAVDAARAGAVPLPGDDLDDPWGRGDQCFSRVADEIEETIVPLARLLIPS